MEICWNQKYPGLIVEEVDILIICWTTSLFYLLTFIKKKLVTTLVIYGTPQVI